MTGWKNFPVPVGDSRPPPSWTEQSEIERYLGSYGRSPPPDAGAYGSALGFPSMRRQVARPSAHGSFNAMKTSC